MPDSLPRTRYFIEVYPLYPNKTKKVRLNLIYKVDVDEANTVFTAIQEYAINNSMTVDKVVNEINWNLTRAINKVFASEIIERLLGSVFNIGLIVQLKVSTIFKAATGAFYVKQLMQQNLPEEKKKTVPVANDMRLLVNLNWVLEESINSLASTLLHEIIHVLDENSSKKLPTKKDVSRTMNSEEELTVATNLRDEGIAVFGEIINNPRNKLNLFDQKIMLRFIDKPIPDFELLVYYVKNVGGGLRYYLSTILLMQLFTKFAGEPEAIFNLSRLRQLLIEKQTIAITVLQTAKMLDQKKFFKLYKEQVKQKIFGEELLQELMNV